MSRLRILCGLLALGSSVILLQASDARSRPVCGAKLVRIGPVFAGGCWHRVGTRWVAKTPVTLDGLKLAGGGTVTADKHAATIASSGSVRWLIGPVQIRHAPFSWTWRHQLAFTATGGVRGLAFGGDATLAFTGTNGGTATFSGRVNFKALGATVSGDAVLAASRSKGFDVQKVHVQVAELTLERLLFKKLDFSYTGALWSADVAVRLPAFTITNATVEGTVEVANGAVRGITIKGSGLSVPLGEGFILNKAGLALNFHPVVIQGTATATYGPSLGGASALQIDGSLQYSSEGHHWDANGAVSLPWGLPGVKPSVTVDLGLDPGRSMTFAGHLDLTVHGFGITGDLKGFASAKAFNVDGKTTLAFTPLTLHGDSLISSKGMSACGRVRLHAVGFGVDVGPRLGFGYGWGRTFHFIASSCDVGPFRVVQHNESFGPLVVPTQVMTSSPAQFAVFAVKGAGDFQVVGPTGVFSSAGDQDTVNEFSFHDTTDNTTYMAIPVLADDAQYDVTTLAGAPVPSVDVASGVKSLAGDVTGGVSGSGRSWTLTYGISNLPAGETVSFFEGEDTDVPGANPIVENVTTGGVAPITPDATGDPNRFVYAIVYGDDGVPREKIFIAGFTTTDVPPPSASVFIRTPPTPPGGWTIQFFKVQRVATWEIATNADDGRHESVELPVGPAGYAIDPGTAKHVTVDVTPVDQYGREGPTYVCDSAKLGSCPVG